MGNKTMKGLIISIFCCIFINSIFCKFLLVETEDIETSKEKIDGNDFLETSLEKIDGNDFLGTSLEKIDGNDYSIFPSAGKNCKNGMVWSPYRNKCVKKYSG